MDFAYLNEVFKSLLNGLGITLLIFSVTLISSIFLGLIGAMLKKISIRTFFFLERRNRILNIISRFNPLKLVLDLYTWVVRGTPLLLQLFFVLYGLPIIFGGLFLMDRMTAAILTFVINYTAYFIEIFRGGMNTISKGQFEACEVLGLSRIQAYSKVILPQTFKKVIPSITNEAITLVKDTALVASVAIADLLKCAKDLVNHSFRLEAYFVAAVIYLFFSYIIVFIFKKIEKKYAYYR